MTFYSERRTTCKTRQQKKHYTQMTLQEKKDCINLLKNSCKKDYFKLTYHFKEKCKVRLNFNTLKNFILKNKFSYFNVIEYNETQIKYGIEQRIVLKYPRIVRVDNEPCFKYIVMTPQGKLLTTYYNKINDLHRTLDLSYYNENLKIKVDNL